MIMSVEYIGSTFVPFRFLILSLGRFLLRFGISRGILSLVLGGCALAF